MAALSTDTLELQTYLDKMRAGDAAARDELLRRAGGRLERLTRKMLRDFPGVKRWEQTDDVLQNALVRLLRALKEIEPASVREFLALTALQIRRELVDLARHYGGPLGPGAHHATRAGLENPERPLEEKPDPAPEAGVLDGWHEFHSQVDRLPAPEREVVDLLFYQGLPQAEAAALLKVTVRTVQRRWQAALLELHGNLKGQWPGGEP
jgi:RNA polymerase sigma-70 factor (ECF subfamily)